MQGKTFSGLILIVLLTGILTSTINIQPVKASGTIYIRPDGSVDPPDAPVITFDDLTYTLTDNITSSADGIVVERSNITIDGTGYTLQGSGTGKGFYYSGINNVTIKNTNIKNFDYSVYLFSSSNNTISGNNITENSGYGIWPFCSSNNEFYHNNFIDNSGQVYSFESANIWDDGYSSGGNYWSDYAGTDLCRGSHQDETGSDGIGDTPYIIDENNTDRYPLVKPYAGPHDIGLTNIATSKTVVGQEYSLHINITMFNYGNNTENFNFTVYANTTIIDVFENVTLTSRNSTTITILWNTTGWIKGNYTISANATAVLGEIDTTDNNSTDGWVFVTIQGDVDGDRDVDIYDVVKITGIYGSKRGDPQFNPNSDLDDDDEIKIYDVVRCTSHYRQSW